MLLPDSAELKIQVPLKSRNTAWASFDGRHRVELTQGDYICITMSKYPVPTVCMRGQGTDWFESLRRCLHWNERRPQKPFGDVDVEIDESKLRPDDSSLEALAQQLFED